MPRHWVVRDKGADYGIDLEVELFEADGSSTGIIFLVQLKATASKIRSVQMHTSISLDHLAYFLSHDAPVLIFRWCEETQQLFFRWSEDVVLDDVAGQTGEAVSVAFSEENLWVAGSAEDLSRRIKEIRYLSQLTVANKFPVSITIDHVTVQDPFPIELAVRDAMSSTRVVYAAEMRNAKGVVIDCAISGSSIVFQLGSIGMIGVPMSQLSDIGQTFLYGLCHLFLGARLPHHAEQVALLLLSRRLKAPDRLRAYVASKALIGRLPEAIKLAMNNALHLERDILFRLFVEDMYTSPYSETDRLDWIARLHTDAAEKALEAGDLQAAGMAYYTIGNNLLNSGVPQRYAGAIAFFNKASKCDPTYLERSYFLQEVGATLFLTRHYRSAASFYQRIIDEKSSAHDRFCWADALMFSGQFDIAVEQFDIVVRSNVMSNFRAESIVKLEVCRWIIDLIGRGSIKRRRTLAQDAVRKLVQTDGSVAVRTYEMILSEIDPLHDLSAFNLGVVRAAQANYRDAMMLFLIEAFDVPWDAEAWGNVLACMINYPLRADFMGALMQTACHLGGPSSYQRLRSMMEEQGAPREAIRELDALASQVFAEVRANQEKRDVRLRTVQDGVVVEIDDINS